MTAIFTKKSYKPSVYSFQILYSVHQHQCFQWLYPHIDCNVLNDSLLLSTAIFTVTDYFKWVSSFKSNIVKNDSSLLRRKLINQAFLLFNYCNLYINIGVFNDCPLILTVMFSMMVYFWVLLYLHWLTISNECPVSNPILLIMTALFTEIRL